jgi:hypothetical protein
MAALLLVALALQPPFAHSVSRVTAAQLPHSWHRGCPVAPSELRRLRVSYWGFDRRGHTGTLVVATRAVPPLVRVFSRLYTARFPIRRMRPVDAYGGSDERSLAADNTAAFNCRYAIAPGPRRWSAHAYGLAIDVNPVENPYLEGGRVHPAAGRAYLDRSRVRRGMAVRGGVLVRVFAAVGWSWGGRWRGTPDYQHFSAGGPEERRNHRLAAGRVVPVDHGAERVERDVLGQRHAYGEPPRRYVEPTPHFLVGEAEDGAVRGVQRKAREPPVRPPRHRLAQQRDVRVVAVQQPLVERLRQAPRRGRRGARECGAQTAVHRHAPSSRRNEPPPTRRAAFAPAAARNARSEVTSQAPG